MEHENEKTNDGKGICPVCAGERSCKKHGEKYQPWYYSDRDGNSMSGGVRHTLLECNGCETVFYQTSSWHEDDFDYYVGRDGKEYREASYTINTYPKPESTVKPTWLDMLCRIDHQLCIVLKEVYIAYDNDAHILTAIGLRTIVDRATEVLGIDPAITFEGKLQALFDEGWIGSSERDILDVVTNAGSAAAHRGWSPDKQQIDKLLNVTQVFIHRAIILGAGALDITQSIPPKPKRRKS